MCASMPINTTTGCLSVCAKARTVETMAAMFQNGRRGFSNSHISAKNIGTKLSLVFIYVAVAAMFQNGRREYSVSHISANNMGRN